MCEANAYVMNDDGEELYLESVDIVRPEEGKLYLRNLFGEQKIFDGEVEEISLLKHKIILKRTPHAG